MFSHVRTKNKLRSNLKWFFSEIQIKHIYKLQWTFLLTFISGAEIYNVDKSK